MGNISDKTTEKQSFSAFVRHGESADEVLALQRSQMVVPRSETNECDPPLTKVGLAEATITGLFLKTQFDNIIRPTDIVIKCSPFIRCIMTACAIATQIGEGKGKNKKFPTVEVDGGLAEGLFTERFDTNPVPNLEIFNCHSKEEIEDLKRTYKIDQKINIKIDYLYEIQKAFPEPKWAAQVRLIKHWAESREISRSERTAIINVTHGRQITQASKIERLYSHDRKDPARVEFMETLEEILAKQKSGARLTEEAFQFLEKGLKSEVDPKLSFCSITAGLHTDNENEHQVIFHRFDKHLKTKLAVEQTKFLAGFKR